MDPTERPHPPGSDTHGSSRTVAPSTDPEVVLFDDGTSDVSTGQTGLRTHRVTTAAALRMAVRALRRGVIAVVAPPATPDEITFVSRARTGRDGLRAILVNGAPDTSGRLTALALGFDDAVPLSMGGPEIGGRIGLLAERTRDDSADRLPVGPGIELDLSARALRRHGRLVHLRPMEFRLLEELARNAGRPISREWLLRRVWGSDGLDGSRTVDVHMRWLRAKVERDPERPVHLLTVRGVGYQLELGTEITDDAERADRSLTSR